jgi:hypothetical protein
MPPISTTGFHPDVAAVQTPPTEVTATAANPSVGQNLFMAPRPNTTGRIALLSVAPRTAAAKRPASTVAALAAGDEARRPNDFFESNQHICVLVLLFGY